MNQKAQDIVVAGAGITGLMIALQLTKTHPGSRITVFDRAAEVGGMYASVKYASGQVFDHGMHVIYESCTPAIDDLYREVMPPQDWHILEQNEKDIAGLFFRGTLQPYSHYVDLRSFPETQRRQFAASVMQAAVSPRPEAIESCGEFLEAQFGPEIVHAVHDQVLDALYGIPASEASTQAVRLTALERVILFDAPTMLDLMKADRLRSRLAFPDQLNLPPYRANTQKALYPKQFGMGHFVDRLKQLLLSRGVALRTSASLAHVHRDGERIESVTLSADGKADERLPVDALVWTVGWPTLARSLGVSLEGLAPPSGGRRKLAIANLVFDRAPAMDRLYYFYCYDAGFATFRVTNYSNYCPAASADGTFPVGVELWPERLGAGSENLTDDELVALAVNELRQFGVIGDHQMLFGAIQHGGEFPLPSLQADRQLREVRHRVRAVLPKNVIVAGIQAEPDLFFVPDILNDAFGKLATL